MVATLVGDDSFGASPRTISEDRDEAATKRDVLTVTRKIPGSPPQARAVVHTDDQAVKSPTKGCQHRRGEVVFRT
jgi:Ni,Fe-hydrogenase III small subunit